MDPPRGDWAPHKQYRSYRNTGIPAGCVRCHCLVSQRGFLCFKTVCLCYPRTGHNLIIGGRMGKIKTGAQRVTALSVLRCQFQSGVLDVRNLQIYRLARQHLSPFNCWCLLGTPRSFRVFLRGISGNGLRGPGMTRAAVTTFPKTWLCR